MFMLRLVFQNVCISEFQYPDKMKSVSLLKPDACILYKYCKTGMNTNAMEYTVEYLNFFGK